MYRFGPPARENRHIMGAAYDAQSKQFYYSTYNGDLIAYLMDEQFLQLTKQAEGKI